MTAAQTNLYFFEWGQARKHYLAEGIDPKQADHKRHELHVAALGRDKSSKELSNADLDKVLGKFRAVYDGGNLDAQLAQLDQPEHRRANILEQCHDACWQMYSLGDNRMAKHRDAYIARVARNVIKKELADCNAAELGVVRGCLIRRVGVLRKKNPTAAASLDAKCAQQPF